ncbi:MAG: TraR/DksA C4-type zinc finger protein [Pseudomonadota bacterium]
MVALYRSSHREIREGMILQSEQDVPRDEGDEAQRAQARDFGTRLAESKVVLAQRIEEALRRITRGEYGRCIDCGQQIETARLLLIPWAQRCQEDEEAAEFEARDRSPSL